MSRRTGAIALVVALCAALSLAHMMDWRAVASVLLGTVCMLALVGLIILVSDVRSQGATQRRNLSQARLTVSDKLDNVSSSVRAMREGAESDSSALTANATKRRSQQRLEMKLSEEIGDVRTRVGHLSEGLDLLGQRLGRIEGEQRSWVQKLDQSEVAILDALSFNARRASIWRDADRRLLDEIMTTADESRGALGGVAQCVDGVETQLADIDSSLRRHEGESSARFSVFSSSLREDVQGIASWNEGAEASRQDRLIDLCASVHELTRMLYDLSERVGELQESEQSSASSDPEQAEIEQIHSAGSIAKLTGATSEIAKRQSSYRDQLITAMRTETQQNEALMQLLPKISPRWLLPPLGQWAVDARAMLHLSQIVDDVQPKRILELGSGTSSVWLGYFAESLGAKVVSVEHEDEFADRTEALLELHGLTDIVTVKRAPLTPLTLGGQEYSWYSRTFIDEVSDVDLLFVDGPVGTTNPWARYPAVPMLWQALAANAWVVLDDSNRPDETAAVDSWVSDYPLTPVHVGLSRLAVLRPNAR